MSRHIYSCYCGEEIDDGRAVLCEHCKTWQHEKCVNITKFDEPEHYVCPSCRNMEIDCLCGDDSDFRKALVYCTKCHKYFHKRHVGIGYGKNPIGFVCPDCSNNKYMFIEQEVKPIPSYLPVFNIDLLIHSAKSMASPLPPGLLKTKLEQINGHTSAAALCAYIYSNFRSVIFQAHPTIESFLFLKGKGKYNINEKANDSWEFCVHMIRSIAFMASITRYQVVQILDHLISLDIYKKPISPIFREEPGIFQMNVSEKELNSLYDFSERGEDSFLAEKPKFKYEKPRHTHTARMKIVDGPLGMSTVVTDEDIQAGDMICYAYGNVLKLEEIDKDSRTPEYEMYRIANSSLVLDTSSLKRPAIFQHIRRGFVSNCELRAFDIGDNRFLGIFATVPTPLPFLANRKPLEQNHHIIRKGDELVLPFDIAPPCINLNIQWYTNKSQKYNMKVSELIAPKPEQPTFEEILESSKIDEETSQEEETFKPANKKEQQFSLLKDLFEGPTHVYVQLTTNTKPKPITNPELGDHLDHFPLPGKKGWGKNVEEPPVEMIEAAAPWYYKSLSIDCSQNETTSQTYQRPRKQPKRITLWKLSTSSDDENTNDTSSKADDSTESESFDRRGLIDISEEYLSQLQNS